MFLNKDVCMLFNIMIQLKLMKMRDIDKNNNIFKFFKSLIIVITFVNSTSLLLKLDYCLFVCVCVYIYICNELIEETAGRRKLIFGMWEFLAMAPVSSVLRPKCRLIMEL